MAVTGKLTRRDLAQTMPVHADPLHFDNASFQRVNQVTFSYRTNTDAAAKLLPAALEIEENPKVSVMFLNYGFSTVGPFREYIHIIHASHRGEERGFVPHIFITDERGMIAGREREGYPKLLGEIDFDMEEEENDSKAEEDQEEKEEGEGVEKHMILFAFSSEDDPKGVQHDLPIEHEGDVLEVHEVIFHAFEHFVHVLGVTKLDHSPGGETRFYF